MEKIKAGGSAWFLCKCYALLYQGLECAQSLVSTWGLESVPHRYQEMTVFVCLLIVMFFGDFCLFVGHCRLNSGLQACLNTLALEL
jgi:hypothetical protein